MNIRSKGYMIWVRVSSGASNEYMKCIVKKEENKYTPLCLSIIFHVLCFNTILFKVC
jgi:hypothetical protein